MKNIAMSPETRPILCFTDAAASSSEEVAAKCDKRQFRLELLKFFLEPRLRNTHFFSLLSLHDTCDVDTA
uniref:Uncharacterized protein n=1 Tax=Acrobeloides nanus TaxID=290746 RepID=A0A914DLQ6_9BILA